MHIVGLLVRTIAAYKTKASLEKFRDDNYATAIEVDLIISKHRFALKALRIPLGTGCCGQWRPRLSYAYSPDRRLESCLFDLGSHCHILKTITYHLWSSSSQHKVKKYLKVVLTLGEGQVYHKVFLNMVKYSTLWNFVPFDSGFLFPFEMKSLWE